MVSYYTYNPLIIKTGKGSLPHRITTRASTAKVHIFMLTHKTGRGRPTQSVRRRATGRDAGLLNTKHVLSCYPQAVLPLG